MGFTEVPDCWAAKPVRMWSEDDVAEWLTSLGVSHERMAEINFRMSGMELAMHSLDRNFIASIESDINVEIYRSLQGYLEQETPTTEQTPPCK